MEETPRNWKYTWEAQSQLPILKLLLFSHTFNPSLECRDLNAQLKFEISLLAVSWTEAQSQSQVSLSVPVPKVLVDLESPLHFRALEDHIEFKIALLLPVDHPIVSGFVSDLYQEDAKPPSCHFSKPLILESDVERLATKGESHFYCRTCSYQLTQRPIRSFVEMPSVDWRETADNWFDACCCSFGGISEKMVATYTKSHACRQGSCLLATTSITLYQDDLVGFNSSNDSIKRHAVSSSITSEDRLVHCINDSLASVQIQDTNNSLSEEDDEHKDTDVASTHRCCSQSLRESPSKDQEIIKTVDLSIYQKLLLNGYLGNVFMFKSSGLSNDIEWVEFKCLKCSSLLGAYPTVDGHKLIDGGIRLLKCYISTSTGDSSGDLFRTYTLDRMFSAQLMENANDELSFRTAVKDLKTKSLMLQMILLNPDLWHCNGSCKEGSMELTPMVYLRPVIKVLFSVSSGNDSGSSVCESQRKDQMEEVFMLNEPIKQVRRSLELSSGTLPPSLTSLQGNSLSVLGR